MNRISASSQDYLEAILELADQNGTIRFGGYCIKT